MAASRPPNESEPETDSRTTAEMVVVGSITVFISALGDLSIWSRGHSTHVRIQHADIDDLQKALDLARKELPSRDGQK